MKKCPFCAEEIQDAAIVCKHCGRDLKGGASQVQIVEAKKKTGCASWGCLTIIVLIVFAWLMTVLFPGTPTTTTSSSSSSSTAAGTTPAAPARTTPTITAEDLERQLTGEFLGSSASAIEKDGTWIVLFEPGLPLDDETIVSAIRYALGEFLEINTANATWRTEEPVIRFITGSGIFDVLIVRSERALLAGLTIVRRE